ncbi:uncharacterized protein CANTADRAFT_24429 [Suhomyces tanzawaensis NRRL Y-17324]|uniref:Uncharacterized protein n=1 Tax=Suhomyces tanzawaensis NRRL Y-17324 TaxID=984487 RepID=A0A1E4SPR6_9ASCO|nr:uncharacterized protein CANTADRAFT_24429 [Suhomyces tanzawaensis NRRL Y-17324]ODV81514.1 hypothetical protein CANTADRAFT_24429 [Suhomyces tanzawaensis NRRL Y-17324]
MRHLQAGWDGVAWSWRAQAPPRSLRLHGAHSVKVNAAKVSISSGAHYQKLLRRLGKEILGEPLCVAVKPQL